uniref:Uncharacterized protein n=1 Tax=viral metagenome TaxID=1070528 RepID=A0A6M3XIA5_9ZZZZ
MPRYDSIRKDARNKMVWELWKAHPDWSLAELAKPFDISRQRAAAIIKAETRRQKVR